MLIARVLIATLGLLALATAASAECAWVQWTMVNGPRGVWQPLSAFGTREQCIAHMSVASAGFVGKTVNTVAESIDTGDAAYVDKSGKITFLEKCLPDTVDPRGPKK
jgi:hypothetical protein